MAHERQNSMYMENQRRAIHGLAGSEETFILHSDSQEHGFFLLSAPCHPLVPEVLKCRMPLDRRENDKMLEN